MTDIDKPQDPHRLRNNIFIIAGTVVVIATYLYLILAQPAVVDENFALNGTGAVIPRRRHDRNRSAHDSADSRYPSVSATSSARLKPEAYSSRRTRRCLRLVTA